MLGKVLPPPLALTFGIPLLHGGLLKALLAYWGLWSKGVCIGCGSYANRRLRIEQYIRGRKVKVVEVPLCLRCEATL